MMAIDEDENENDVKYLLDIHKIAEEADRLYQRGSASSVFSKLHRSLFIIVINHKAFAGLGLSQKLTVFSQSKYR